MHKKNPYLNIRRLHILLETQLGMRGRQADDGFQVARSDGQRALLSIMTMMMFNNNK
jgi:hypothetical protein